MPRTYPIVWDHLEAVRSYLASQVTFPVNHWERPVDPTTELFLEPPLVMIRVFPSAQQMDGPLSDSQADVILRFQLLSVGVNSKSALVNLDICRPHMQRRNITIANRFVMDLKLMVASGGESRNDDLPTPLMYAQDLYEIQTTPA